VNPSRLLATGRVIRIHDEAGCLNYDVYQVFSVRIKLLVYRVVLVSRNVVN
jgi:hypothetical protein